MQTNTLYSAMLASMAISLSKALPTIQENSLVPLGDPLKTSHPDAYNAFLTAPLITLDVAVARRQDVPADSTPDPNRPIVTPPYIFVLQCDLAGFRGSCLSFGAAPGDCGKKDNGCRVVLKRIELTKTETKSTTAASTVVKHSLTSMRTRLLL